MASLDYCVNRLQFDLKLSRADNTVIEISNIVYFVSDSTVIEASNIVNFESPFVVNAICGLSLVHLLCNLWS